MGNFFVHMPFLECKKVTFRSCITKNVITFCLSVLLSWSLQQWFSFWVLFFGMSHNAMFDLKMAIAIIAIMAILCHFSHYGHGHFQYKHTNLVKYESQILLTFLLTRIWLTKKLTTHWEISSLIFSKIFWNRLFL